MKRILKDWIEEIERNKDIWSPGTLKKVIGGVTYYSTLGMLMRILIRGKIGLFTGVSVKEEPNGFSMGGYNYLYLVPKAIATFVGLPFSCGFEEGFIEKEKTMTVDQILDYLRSKLNERGNE